MNESDASKTALVVGLGRMGMRHVQALKAAGVATVLGWDPRAESEENARKAGVTWLGEIREAADSGPQLAIIASTAPAHLENLRSVIALKTVGAVLCEKPMACSVDECDAMIALAAQGNIRLGINFYRRFSEPYLALRRMGEDGKAMGSFVSMAVTCGAGGMACNGIHYFDLGRFLFRSEAISVAAFSRDLHLPVTRGAQFEDPGLYAVVNFAGGQRMFLDFGDDFGLPQHVEICAEHGRILIDEASGRIQVFARPAQKRPVTLRHYGEPLEEYPFTMQHPSQLIETSAAALRNLLNTSEAIRATAEDGIASLEIYTAMRISAERGGAPVAVPLTSDERANRYSIT